MRIYKPTYRQDRLGNNDHGQLNQLCRETKTDMMKKLRRELQFVEWGMQRVRTKLNKIQQDPLLTPTTSLTGIKPKQLIEPEYPEYYHHREQMIHEHATYPEQNDLIKKQIRADALLSRQLQEEERDHTLKENKLIDYDVPSVHHIGRLWVKRESNDKQLQDTDYKHLVRSFMAYQAPNYHKRQEIENPTLRVPSGYFQAKTNLQTGNVIGSYYNTQPRVTFDNPWDLQTSCEKSNQRIPLLA